MAFLSRLLWMYSLIVSAGLLSGIGVLVFLIRHRDYRLWSPPRVLLWLLLLLASAALAFALDNLLWDLTGGQVPLLVAGPLVLLVFPAVWLPCLRFFRQGRDRRGVWRAVAVTAIGLVGLVLVWAGLEAM